MVARRVVGISPLNQTHTAQMISMWSDVLTIGIAATAGAIAAVTGLGIGSLLTPILALSADTRVAVLALILTLLGGVMLTRALRG